jgi:outer membrane lipopolysaccharide assembly protein LptE/RlpB
VSRALRVGLAALLLTVLAGVGCGYRPAGSATRLPANLHTLAIPAFENKTTTYQIEQTMTAAVVREFLTRTRFRVLPQASSEADATLLGTVTSVGLSPITYSSQTGRASSVMVTVTARVRLLDRAGKVLFENPSYILREEYEISQDPSSFFQEESAAFQRLTRDFARSLVSNVLEAY